MKKLCSFAVLALVLLSPAVSLAKSEKIYRHASRYQVAVLDRNLRVDTGSDVTVASNSTDAKLGPGGQGIHLLYTPQGNYRVEAPVNSGLTALSALSTMGSGVYHQAETFHNKWFMDNVQPGTKVLFASACERPSKKHPNNAVRCTFWFPDPDSTSHEYLTWGDFTPYSNSDASNVQKTADALCGTGKLNPEVEAQVCTLKSR